MPDTHRPNSFRWELRAHQAQTRTGCALSVEGSASCALSAPRLTSRLTSCLAPLLLLGGTALPVAGCGDVNLDPTENTPVDTTGAVAGRVCAPTGDAWLENAYVYTNLVDENGRITGIRETYSDPDGYFVLTRVPEQSSVTVYIQKGTYQTSFETSVKKGEVTRQDEPPCLDPLSINAAVVAGSYDSFSSLLEALGVTNYGIIDGAQPEEVQAFFGDLAGLLGYDVVCLNGGMEESLLLNDPIYAENLAEYVRAGGALFATDWSYDWVERSFPEAIDFLGEDEVLDSAQRGVAEVVSASVVDQALAGYIGGTGVELRYDLAFWPVVEGAVGQVVIHVAGDIQAYDDASNPKDVSGAPLLLSFSAGYGTVVYSTFRGESNLTDDTARILQYMLYKL